MGRAKLANFKTFSNNQMKQTLAQLKERRAKTSSTQPLSNDKIKRIHQFSSKFSNFST